MTDRAEIEWRHALDEYEALLQHQLRALEGDAPADRVPRMVTPPSAMPASMLPRAMELLERTRTAEERAEVLRNEVQRDLVPQRSPAVAETLPTMVDRRL